MTENVTLPPTTQADFNSLLMPPLEKMEVKLNAGEIWIGVTKWNFFRRDNDKYYKIYFLENDVWTCESNQNEVWNKLPQDTHVNLIVDEFLPRSIGCSRLHVASYQCGK